MSIMWDDVSWSKEQKSKHFAIDIFWNCWKVMTDTHWEYSTFQLAQSYFIWNVSIKENIAKAASKQVAATLTLQNQITLKLYLFIISLMTNCILQNVSFN